MNIKVKIEKSGPCRKVLAVEVPVQEVDAEYAKVCGDFTRVARLPGFRQGRAPAKLVESRFAGEIREEIRDRLIGRSYTDALKQAQLKPLMILDLQAEVEPKKPMVYRLTLDVPPEFKLPKYKRISITQKPVDVTEADIQRAFEGVLERFATTSPVSDRPARKDDFIQIDYELKNGGEQPKKPDGKKNGATPGEQNFWMKIGENVDLLPSGRDLPPGLSDALVGLAVGEEKEVSLKLPQDFKIKSLAGTVAVYRVRVKSLREHKMPAMNEEFFKAAGVQSEADLREKIKTSLREEGERLEKQRQKNEIVDYLLGRTSIDLPESIVQEETRHMYAGMVRERLMRGGTREQIEAQRGELLSAAAKSAGDKVKLGYILHEIGETEKIEVADSELENEMRNMSRRYRMPYDELKKELEEKKEIDSLRSEIRMGKILDFLLQNAEAGAGEKGIISRLFKGGEAKPGA